MELRIDIREKQIIQFFKENQQLSEVKFPRLDIGDIHCVLHDEIVLIIERKTLSDLAASIKDGRYREQKMRLSTSGYPFIYLIEGTVPQRFGAKVNRLPAKTISGCLLNMSIRDRIPIIFSQSCFQTCQILEHIYEKLMKNPKLFKRSDPQHASNKEKHRKEDEGTVSLDEAVRCMIKPSKKANMTPTLCSIAQLAQIPSISRIVAKGIVDVFGSFYGLCIVMASKSTEEEKKNLLTNKTFKSKNGELKTFGPHISKQVYSFVTGIVL